MLIRRLASTDSALIVPLVKQVLPSSDPSPCLELSEDDAPLSEPFLPGLCLLFAFDRPLEYEIVAGRHARALGLAPSLIRALAVTNLRRRLPDIQRHGDHPAYMLTAGGNLESSLLLLDDLWDQQSMDVPGALVVAVPARDVLLFTGSDSPAGLSALRSSIERVWPDGDHLLTRELFTWRAHSWSPFEPAAA